MVGTVAKANGQRKVHLEISAIVVTVQRNVLMDRTSTQIQTTIANTLSVPKTVKTTRGSALMAPMSSETLTTTATSSLAAVLLKISPPAKVAQLNAASMATGLAQTMVGTVAKANGQRKVHLEISAIVVTVQRNVLMDRTSTQIQTTIANTLSVPKTVKTTRGSALMAPMSSETLTTTATSSLAVVRNKIPPPARMAQLNAAAKANGNAPPSLVGTSAELATSPKKVHFRKNVPSRTAKKIIRFVIMEIVSIVIQMTTVTSSRVAVLHTITPSAE